MVFLDVKKIKSLAENIKNDLITTRRDIHAHPETALNEVRTASVIAKRLRELGIEVQENIGITGVVGLLKGEKPGKTILLRSDMDCLPLDELNTCEYKSENKGLMHACGHDAHVTWLLGAAEILCKFRKELCGSIKFLFQPAEESSGGAERMIKEGVLENPPVDAAIAAHVWPSCDAGKIAIKYGSMMAAPDKFKIIIKGKGGHGAMPNLCVDPIAIGHEIYNSLQTIGRRKVDPLEPFILSVCRFSSGSAFNIIPDSAEIEGTVRTVTDELRERIPGIIETIVKSATEANGAGYEFQYYPYYPAVINDFNMTKLLETAAENFLGKENIDILHNPVMIGEDFSFFQRKVPAVFFGIGTYNESKNIIHNLHSPYFDIDEDILPLASGFFAWFTMNYLNNTNMEL